MDSSFRRSPGTERFLSLFSPPPSPSPLTSPDKPTQPHKSNVDELHEDELFFFSAPSPERTGPNDPLGLGPTIDPSGPTAASLRRIPYKSFGLLAALNDPTSSTTSDNKTNTKLVRRSTATSYLSSSTSASAAAPAMAAVHDGSLLRRKATIAAAVASTSPSPAAATSPSSQARAIPVTSKPKPESARVFHQSAPVKVPVRPPPRNKGWGELDDVDDDDEEEGDDVKGDVARLPPHEMVARASGSGGVGRFSMLEGAGRTLKGRDLHRVRDAVLRRTGFLD